MGFPAAFTAPFANAMLTGSSLDYESDDITAETEIRPLVPPWILPGTLYKNSW